MIRVLMRLHPLFHRRGSQSACWLCSWVWHRMEVEGGQIMEDIAQGIADIEAGRLVKWSEIRDR